MNIRPFVVAVLGLILTLSATQAGEAETFHFKCKKIGRIVITTEAGSKMLVGNSVTLSLPGKPPQTLALHADPKLIGTDYYSNANYRFFTYRAYAELTALKNGKDVKTYACD